MSEYIDTVVIGGGQAGLAMGHALAGRGRKFVIVDASDRVGDAWRNRWDSLVLLTPRAYSALPGLAMPGDPEGYPGKDEMADYLESYAARFALPVRLGAKVTSLERTGDTFRVRTAGGTIGARSVAIAAGAYQVPAVPAVASAFSPEVRQFTTASYKNPAGVPAGTVLVAGDGATGRQIALELAATHTVVLATGRPRSVGPDRILGRSIFWWLDRLGILDASRESRIGRRLMARDPFPGRHLTLPRLREAGVAAVPRLATAEGTIAHFEDGRCADVSAVIWATGYRDDTTWLAIPEAKRPDGGVIETRGISPVPGLYFIGRSWQWTRGSALVLGVGKDAAYIADHSARSETARPQMVRVEAAAPAAQHTGLDREPSRA
jgi:putative flavoprotein involved in K+ transport